MSSQTIDITTQRLTLNMDMKIGEEPSTDPSPATRAQCTCGIGMNVVSDSSSAIGVIAVFEKISRGSSDLSTIRVKPIPSSMKIPRGTRSKLFTLALHHLVALQERAKTMISRNQTALSRLRFIACSVFMTLELIVICWELHGMRSELSQQSQLQQRSLHNTGQVTSKYRGWLSLTLPSILACSVAGRHLLKKLSKNFGRPHKVAIAAPDRTRLKFLRRRIKTPFAAPDRSEVSIKSESR